MHAAISLKLLLTCNVIWQDNIIVIVAAKWDIIARSLRAINNLPEITISERKGFSSGISLK